LRKLEKQHGLTEVISSRQAQERAMTKNELEMMKRTDSPSVKMKLQVILKEVLSKRVTTQSSSLASWKHRASISGSTRQAPAL
jgi:hypothetical protein